jgi:hypothetical protein
MRDHGPHAHVGVMSLKAGKGLPSGRFLPRWPPDLQGQRPNYSGHSSQTEPTQPALAAGLEWSLAGVHPLHAFQSTHCHHPCSTSTPNWTSRHFGSHQIPTHAAVSVKQPRPRSRLANTAASHALRSGVGSGSGAYLDCLDASLPAGTRHVLPLTEPLPPIFCAALTRRE